MNDNTHENETEVIENTEEFEDKEKGWTVKNNLLREAFTREKTEIVGFFYQMRSSSIWRKKWGHLPWQKIEVVFHFQKNWGRLPFLKEIEVVFHFQQNWGRRPFSKKCRSFSIFHLLGLKQCCIAKVSSIGCLEQNWGRLSFIKNVGRLLFSKILRSSSIFHLVGSK